MRSPRKPTLISASMIPLLAVALSGCGTGRPDLPRASAVSENFPIPDAAQQDAQLRFKPYDLMSVKVYQEPQLGIDEVTIDAAGYVMVPMLGQIPAAGKSPSELAAELKRRYSEAYLRDPQVTVERKSGILDRVSVLGAVKTPGQYAVRGPVTLLDALAMAEGTTQVARRGDVAVIRMIDGRRAGALFNIADIEQGKADDPAILPSDKIIVGTSAIRQGYRDLLQAVPLIGLGFRYF